MPTNVILPALGMAQETGKIIRWLKSEGEQVARGEPLAEIETDKATVELEAPAAGLLVGVTAADGEEIPVGQVIATILAPGELASATADAGASTDGHREPRVEAGSTGGIAYAPGIPASPLASRIAAEHNLDLSQVKPSGRRIQKADVLSHIQEQQQVAPAATQARLMPASPKARRLASERGMELASIRGSGPGGAVLTADVVAAQADESAVGTEVVAARADESAVGTINRPLRGAEVAVEGGIGQQASAISNTWRIMAERTTQSWTSVPHFYLVREVNARRLIAWREQVLKRSGERVTYTDLLVKVVAAVLRQHPRLNAAWHAGSIMLNDEVNVGLAVAVEEGLVVPVIRRADGLRLGEIAERRKDLAARAEAGRLRPEDLRDGTFTISNLGMYGVDAFNAIINPPQAAILAVGRIASRVVPVDDRPVVQPMMVLSLGCDHRVVDGARGAQFLADLAELIEEPLGLLG